ncbi:NgoMIV family type II restriction endonuclease [Roseibium sp. RKSG952]|uniref:NgoMIV family type II restriction endonuclease n=1 Tax=Roseibium sp. RKSG952 TaxID=2529384 RepID=UPI0012BD51F7|nr:NgoMIV family type II restriction endonuclease [Roseibium sp. RKSG952]MTH95046.1 hypothetical protein [Roseibium sp. RKSG952]
MSTNEEHLLQGVLDCRRRFHDTLTGAWVGNRIKRRTRDGCGRLRKWGDDMICPIWFFTGEGESLKASNGDTGKEISNALGEIMNLRHWKEIHAKLPKSYRNQCRSLGARNPPSRNTKGSEFEKAIRLFLEESFLELVAPVYRPGDYLIRSKQNNRLEEFSQYVHLAWHSKELDLISRLSKDSRAGDLADEARRILDECPHGLPNSYQTSPDVTIARKPKKMPANPSGIGPDNHLFTSFDPHPVLFAICSAKWTLRSDRAQNSRSEVSYLERERRGPKCRFVAVTAETNASIISSIAIGSEVDCTYHVALPELLEVTRSVHPAGDDKLDKLENLIATKRLKDISDLPFDLAV